MLVFNCTEDASKFFSRVHKGKKVTPVEKPPLATQEYDSTDGLPCEEWLVHATTIYRKHVLFVMHVKTRYCMVFPEARKADLPGFLQRLLGRWVHGMMQDATRSGALEYFKLASEFERLQAGDSQYHFYKRGNRSVQGHLNEVVWMFTNLAMEEGLPPDEASVLGWDQWVNGMLKSVKGSGGYLRPSELMLVHWLQQYCGVGEAEVAAVLERHKNMRRNSGVFQ